jgi:hypothetical protein
MIKLVPFKLVFRGEPIWINPDHVVCVTKRGGLTVQTCIRLVNQPEAEDLVVEGSAEEVVGKLTGKAPEPVSRQMRTFSIESEALQALAGEEPRAPS